MKEKSKKKEKFTCPHVFCFFLRVLDGTLLPLCQVFYSKLKKQKRKEINKQEIVGRRAVPVFQFSREVKTKLVIFRLLVTYSGSENFMFFHYNNLSLNYNVVV